MKIIPIVFCFDDNLLIPAGVCLTSLMKHANPNTFYDIFIIHSENENYPNSGYLEKLKKIYQNFNITYRSIGSTFNTAFEIRGITIAAYYRLLIPELIPEYQKIMYHDVDIIFRDDLTEIFEETDLGNYFLAGVQWTEAINKEVKSDIINLGLIPKNYILSGNLIINSEYMRQEKIVDSFKYEVANSKYKYQDQDIINIVCKDKIKNLPPKFCMTIDAFRIATFNLKQDFFSDSQLKEAYLLGTIHYNGPKPWNSYCPNFDIWWEYYRNSIFFDPKYYFYFFYNKLNEHDQLTLWKRIKILFRYFKNGKMKKLTFKNEKV